MPQKVRKLWITAAEAAASGYTWTSRPYTAEEMPMLLAALIQLEDKAYALVKTTDPAGLQIWRPKNQTTYEEA